MDTEKDQVFIKKLTEITLANLEQENFGVQELAEKSGMSRDKLGKRLQLAAGKSIKQFIRETRLHKALEILKNEDITAAEVAYRVGFGSASYFNTCFTGFFGFPPGALKKGDITIPPEYGQFEVGREALWDRVIIRKAAKASLVIISLFILGFLIYASFFKTATTKSEATLNNHEASIAVLPFINLSDSAGNQYFVDGIMEDILTLLSKVNDLRVISRTSVEQFRNSKMASGDIAEKIKAKYLIEGSVQKKGNVFRLWIQLIDATTGHHLWAEVYDGKYSTDIFNFQSRVANKVAASLNIVLKPPEQQKINRNPTKEILAYDLCKKGQELTRKWDFDGEEKYLQLAINTFDNALKIDPDYVAALFGKANALLKSGSFDSSMFYFKKVLFLEPDNASALGGIGGYYLYLNTPDSAFKYFQKAIEINPNGEKAFWNYLGAGQVLFMYRNEIPEALLYYQKAFDRGGDSWPEIHNNISLLFSSIGDYPRAFKYMHNALSMTSSCNYLRASFAILHAQEKYGEALAFIDSIARITPCEQTCDMMRFYLYSGRGEFNKADFYLNNAISSGYKLAEDDYLYKSCLCKGTGRRFEDEERLRNIVEKGDSMIQTGKAFWVAGRALRVAAGYAQLGDDNKALEFLRMLEKYGYIEDPVSLKTFPGFNDLGLDPEFKAIVKRIEDQRSAIRSQINEMELRGDINL